MISVVDYGVGNLGSIVNMFKHVGVSATVVGDASQLSRATKILLPGVGSFDHAMRRIDESGLRDVLTRKALEDRIPILGICLGMQLMTRGSEEGVLPGLGWVDADVRRFPSDKNLKVPHMGWNEVHAVKESPLTSQLPEDARFYFVHSYRVHMDRPSDSLLRCGYGVEFDAAFSVGNLYGAQFHPEKSHRFGMQLFRNFGAI